MKVIALMSLYEEEETPKISLFLSLSAHTEEMSHENLQARREASQKPTLLVLWSWTSSL